MSRKKVVLTWTDEAGREFLCFRVTHVPGGELPFSILTPDVAYFEWSWPGEHSDRPPCSSMGYGLATILIPLDEINRLKHEVVEVNMQRKGRCRYPRLTWRGIMAPRDWITTRDHVDSLGILADMRHCERPDSGHWDRAHRLLTKHYDAVPDLVEEMSAEPAEEPQ